MSNLKKVAKITVKVFAGIFLFYLLVALVLIPLLCPWIIKNRAAHLIGHKVKLRSVNFNPLSWKLSSKGFELLDSNQQIIAGFDKFWLDISFLSLLQKKYRIQSIGFDGLKVNAVLSSEGKINLLELVPKGSKEIVNQDNVSNHDVPKIESKKSAQLPLFVIDLMSIKNSNIGFIDQSVQPNFVTDLSDINLQINNFSTRADQETKISFQAKLDNTGMISNEMLIKPFAAPMTLEMVFKLKDYVLPALTPYVGKYAGHKAKSGELDVKMEYRIADNKLDAKHKILVKGFDFGDKIESKDALNLPFGLALALLEDANGKIDISLPIDGDMSDPDFHYFQLIGKVARNFLLKLVTRPFTFLVSIVGSESEQEDFGYIQFVPGKANLSEAEQEKLKLIVKALKERQSLTLSVKQCYDAVADWQAIKKDTFELNFSALREESKRSENWIYESMYQTRFGMAAFWKLTKEYRLKLGVYDFNKINEEIKRQLIDDGAVDKTALEALAAERAKVAYDFIIAQGFEAKRINIGQVQENQASAGFVPVELELSVPDLN
jgi:Domain of Unknown Function (DUF748)